MSTFSNDDDWNISEGDDCWGEGSSTSIRTLQQQVDLLIGQVTTLISTTNDLGGNLANHINANVVSGEDVHRVNDKYNGIFESLRSIQSAINNLEYSKQNNMTAVPYPSNRGEGYYFTPATITAQLDTIFQSLNNKQDALQVDTEPTAGHGIGYYVTSAGIKAALDSIEAELSTEIQNKLTVVSEIPSNPYEGMTVIFTQEDEPYLKGHTYKYQNNSWTDVSLLTYTTYTIPAHKCVAIDNWYGTGYPSLRTEARFGIFECSVGSGKLCVLPQGIDFSNVPIVVYNDCPDTSKLKVGTGRDYGAQGSAVRATILFNDTNNDISVTVPSYSLGLKNEYKDITSENTIIGVTPNKPTSAGNYVLKTTVTAGIPNYIDYSWQLDDSTITVNAVKKTSPIGLIASWWVDANPNIPEGWYKCDGRRIIDLSDMSATEKARLATVLGNEDRIPVADNMIILGYYPFAREA